MSSLQRKLEVNTPHIDPEWAQEVVGELRQRGANGAQIGAALLEIESHLAASGADVVDAFGKPAEYAASHNLPVGVKWTLQKVIGAAAVGVLVFIGGTMAYTGVLAAITETGASLALPGLAFGLALMSAVAASMPFWNGPLRFISENPVRRVIALILMVALLGAALLFSPGPHLTVAPTTMIVAGLLILAALGLVVSIARRTGRQPHDDPLRFPGA